MALFTTPLTLPDATPTDHIFDWLRQVPGSVAGLYRETAAASMKASLLKTSHTTEKSGRERHMLQRSVQVDLTDPGADDPSSDVVLITVTVAHHPKHSSDDVEDELTIVKNALAVSGLTSRFMAGEI